MKTITLLAVMAVLLQDIIGTTSSVGGPLTDLLILLIAMLTVGIYQAWAKRRGPFGWIVNIVGSIIGGLAAVSFAGAALETLLSLIHYQGAPAKSQSALLYVTSPGLAIFTVLGSWVTLQIIYWFPDRNGRNAPPVSQKEA